MDGTTPMSDNVKPKPQTHGCNLFGCALIIVPLLIVYTAIAQSAFQWRNPTANSSSYFRHFIAVHTFKRLPQYQERTPPKPNQYQFIHINGEDHIATRAGITLCGAGCEDQPTQGVSVTCKDCHEAIQAATSYEDRK